MTDARMNYRKFQYTKKNQQTYREKTGSQDVQGYVCLYVSICACGGKKVVLGTSMYVFDQNSENQFMKNV